MSDPIRDVEAGSTRWRGLVFIGLGIVVVIVVLQVIWLKPPFAYDPTDYLMAARKLGSTIVHHRTLRIGLLFPLRAAIEVFGESQLAFYLPAFLAVALIGAGTYALGVMLFRVPVAVAAAVVGVFNPIVLSWSSQPYPDLLATGFFVVGLALLVSALRDDVGGSRPWMLATLAGAAFGWSYLTRELVVFLFPTVIIAGRLWRGQWKRFAACAAGALSMLALEWVWGAWAFGDPFTRWKVLMASQEESGGAAIEAGVEAMRNQPIVERLGTFAEILGGSPMGPLWLGMLMLAVIGLVARWREPGVRLVGWWAGSWYLFLTVANFAEVLRTSDLVRYWYPLMPAYALLAFAGFEWGVGWLRGAGPRLVGGAVLALAATAIALTWVALGGDRSFTRNGGNEYEDFRVWIRQAEDLPPVIWSDQRTAVALRLYSRSFTGSKRYFEEDRVLAVNNALRFIDLDELDPDGLFVLRDQLFRSRLSNWREVVPGYMADPPDDWSLVASSDNSALIIFDMRRPSDARVLFSVGKSAEHGWRQLDPVITEMSEDPGPGAEGVSLPAGERAVFGDDTSRGMGAVPRTATVEPGSLLRFRFELDVADDTRGWIVFACSLWDGDGGRRRVVASTGWRPELGMDRGEFFCTVPPDMKGPVAVRGVLETSGPIDAALIRLEALEAVG